MGRRRVVRTRASAGGITFLGYWNPRLGRVDWVSRETAIGHIDEGIHTYFVRVGDLDVDVEVVDGLVGPYLRTHRDWTTWNNLLDLRI